MKKLLLTIYFYLALFSIQAYQVQLVFFEFYDSAGQKIQLETNSIYSHVAIGVDGVWFHANPFKYFEIHDDMDQLFSGFLPPHDYIVLEGTVDQLFLDITTLHYYERSPYDRDYLWNNNTFYSSELAAKILGIHPTPMDFSSPYWSNKYDHLNGHPGVSPDDIFYAALNKFRFR